MSGRPLGPDEAALWARVLATVRPLPGKRPPPAPRQHSREGGNPEPKAAVPATPGPRLRASTVAAKPPRPGTTLDSSWDRRLSRGLAAPDFTVDLHGHTLATAYARLDGALEQAILAQARVVLLITGKPPRPDSERPHVRGVIRDAVGDWLAASRHASAIAAVRNAHPRHGGPGALYIVLRRQRLPAA